MARAVRLRSVCAIGTPISVSLLVAVVRRTVLHVYIAIASTMSTMVHNLG